MPSRASTAAKVLKTVAAIIGLLGTGYLLLNHWDRCGVWAPGEPEVKAALLSTGPLRAGAAKVPLEVPLPVVVAGYGPARRDATASGPLFARALVLESGGHRIGLVGVELLLIPSSLTQSLQTASADLQLSALLVVATHSHSSVGAYDPRLTSELAATGRYRADVQAALVKAGVTALSQAASQTSPVRLRAGEGQFENEVVSRSGEPADPRILRARLGQVAQIITLSAHPTNLRDTTTLDADYPGRLAKLQEDADQGVTFVLQAAGGNASLALRTEQRAEEAAARINAILPKVEKTVDEPVLGLAQVTFGLPQPEATRLAPSGTRGIVRNALCDDSPRRAELSVLRLGQLRLIAVPFEVTSGAAKALEAEGGRALSLVDDYLGYLDTPRMIETNDGESRRQYFPASLLNHVNDAVKLGMKNVAQGR
ncbi:MAG: neutral/alkaline non-lysosomal ceramidase N-terminal domain-containing protein [Myxococcaceae bacterium]